MAESYTIGGSSVSGTKWRQVFQPRQDRSQTHTFAGLAVKFRTTDVTLPEAVVVEGELQGANIGAVETLYDAERARVGNGSSYTVVINGRSYSNCVLSRLDVLDPPNGPHQIFAAVSDGTTYARMRVRWTWERLR